MAMITGAGIAARQLRIEGVEAAFGVGGNPMSYLFNRMVAEGIAPHLFRHEAGATLAAMAYGFASRKLGVAVAASGPAMVNAVPSLYTASAQGWPVLLMAGNGQTDRRGLGDFQEAPQVEAATPFTKWSVAIDSPERIPYYVNAAFRRALNGCPGPVYLDFPADILEAEVDESEVEMFPPTAPPVWALGDPNLIAEALEEIKRASPRASALEGRLSIRPQSSVLRFSGRSARGKRPCSTSWSRCSPAASSRCSHGSRAWWARTRSRVARGGRVPVVQVAGK